MRGAAAHAAGLHLMAEILTHFLGVVTEADQVMRMVLSVGEAEMLIGERLSQGPRSFAPVHKPQLAAEPWRPPHGSSITTVDGMTFKLTASLEDVIDLKTRAVVARRLATCVQKGDTVLKAKAVDALPTNSILAIEMQVLDALEGVMQREVGRMVIVPLSIVAVGGARARLATLHRLYRFDPDQRARLTLELTGLDGGTPVARLQEAMAVLKPVCRTIICRALPTYSCLSVLKEAGLRAISVEAQEIGAAGQKLSAGLMAFADAVKPVAQMRIATGLDAPSQVPICALAGYSHATISETAKAA